MEIASVHNHDMNLQKDKGCLTINMSSQIERTNMLYFKSET